ncbi:MAG TPA: UDP-N-acetylmuramate--L-alanine ligase [Ignavibacteria bacterium]|nr:UDP-N-acetylmuramate--L-alanine ligase [Ignavibacteria bacterium]
MTKITNLFENIKKVHLIGIGGIGMSGIAEYLVRKNYIVSGSDMTLSPITKRLENRGVTIYSGHEEKNLPDDTELVIYTSAVKEDNEEYKKAVRLKIKTVKRAEALGHIVNNKFVIAVSGTHGKTTTSAMIAKVLIDIKFDPTVFIGGNLDFLDGGSSRIGKGEIAVVEADEYDRSFYQLRPDIAVITNIEADHLDIYKDLDDIKNSFREFLKNGKKGMKIIACGDDNNITVIMKEFERESFYGFSNSNDHIVKNVSYEKDHTEYSIDGEQIRLRIAGNHNILNSAAAYLAAREVKISNELFNESIKTFYGVKRRLELKLYNGIKVYDDYAHHPTEVEATLEGIKKLHRGRVITVFQPHLFSRTRDFYNEFGKSFSETDILFLLKIYPAREKALEGITSELILNEYLKSGKKGYYIENKDEIINELENIMTDGDLIIFMGAGDITGLCDQFVKKVKSKINGKVPL